MENLKPPGPTVIPEKPHPPSVPQLKLSGLKLQN